MIHPYGHRFVLLVAIVCLTISLRSIVLTATTTSMTTNNVFRNDYFLSPEKWVLFGMESDTESTFTANATEAISNIEAFRNSNNDTRNNANATSMHPLPARTRTTNNANIVTDRDYNDTKTATVAAALPFTTNTTKATSVPLDHHLNIIPLQNISLHSSRRAQLIASPSNETDIFLQDSRILQHQLHSNYKHNSACPRLFLNQTSHPGTCFGLGSTLLLFNKILSNYTLTQQAIISDIDNFTCGWFQRDTTRSCQTMFGNCYLGALVVRGEYQGNESLSSYEKQNYTNNSCYNVSWFVERWGMEAYSSAHLKWLMRPLINHDNNQNDNGTTTTTTEKKNSSPTTSSCVTLHIRRGDVCHDRRRACVDYEDYYHALKLLVQQYPPNYFQRLVVMTDAGSDFPDSLFQTLFSAPGSIQMSSESSRHKYQLSSQLQRKMKRRSRTAGWPENRDMGNATSEFFQEYFTANSCEALVGTFSASISCLLFSHMVAHWGRVPSFVSLQSCLKQVHVLETVEEGCEGSFFVDVLGPQETE